MVGWDQVAPPRRQKGLVPVIATYVFAGYCAVSYLVVGGVLIPAAWKAPVLRPSAAIAVALSPIVMLVWAIGWLFSIAKES